MLAAKEFASFELLEARRLLAADPGVWDITANDASNVISIDYRAADARLLAEIDGQVVLTRKAKGITLLQISAGGGNDRVTINLHRSFPGMQIWINGGSGRDSIQGGVASEMILGGTGNDTIDGGAGSDTLRGGPGGDDEDGGDGDDYVQGNAGSDTLAGGWGGDKLTGGTGFDQLRGGDGEDRLYGGIDPDTIKGGDGADILDGGGAANMLYQQKGTDLLAPNALNAVAVDDDPSGPLQRLQTDDGLKQWLIDQAAKQWSGSFGQPTAGNYWAYDRGMVVKSTTAGGLYSALTPVTVDSGSSADASSTNTQVVGVDEADTVETDGEFLYLLNGGDLVIADATPAKDLKIVSRTAVDGTSSGMYLSGSRVAVISTINDFIYPWRGLPVGIDDTRIANIPIYSEPQVKVTVFDVADKAHPSVVAQTTLDGSIQDSRVIDGRLYLLSQSYLSSPYPKTVTDSTGQEVYETESAYRARLAEGAWRDLLPDYTTTAGTTETSGKLIAAPDVYVRPGERLDTTTVTLFDLGASAQPIAKTSVVGAQGIAYASHENLYLAGTDWSEDGTSTQVVKFGLGVDQITLEAKGIVAGSVLNQFSMDEYGANFRLATTGAWGDGQSSSVFVLDQVGDELQTVGKVEGLGTGERIYSARFMGDRAYLVTFKQVDPLFVMDLSDPTKPKVAGELKIPGFSEYLHPIDADHLIGLGRSTDADGLPGGVQLSLFDVSDPAKPVQEDVYKFGSDGREDSSSGAEYDHHAFSYFADRGVLAIPLERWEAGTFSLEVLKVDPAIGFTLLGEIDQPSGVQRSVRIGGDLFSIGYSEVKAYTLDDLKTELASLTLEAGSGKSPGGPLPPVPIAVG